MFSILNYIIIMSFRFVEKAVSPSNSLKLKPFHDFFYEFPPGRLMMLLKQDSCWIWISKSLRGLLIELVIVKADVMI